MSYTQKSNPFSKTPIKLEKNKKNIEPKGKSRVWDKVKKAGKWYLDADGDGNISKGEIALEAATTLLPIGKLGKIFTLGSKVNKASKVVKGVDKANDVKKFNMSQDALLDSFTPHGAQSFINPRGQDIGALMHWRKVLPNGTTIGENALKKLDNAAGKINNADGFSMKYIGTASKRDVMEISVMNNNITSKIPFIRSTGMGDKALLWVDDLTGKQHKVTSKGINYPVLDKSHVIKDGKRTGASHWYKTDGWETGYGIKNFDELGKGKFIPLKNEAGELVFDSNGILKGTWSGGKISDELIKQTTTIIPVN